MPSPFKDDRGGVALTFAFGCVALVALGAGALSMARLNGASTRLLATGWVGLGLAAVGFMTLAGGASGAAIPLLGFTVVGGLAAKFIKPKPWRLTQEGRRINDELDGLSDQDLETLVDPEKG